MINFIYIYIVLLWIYIFRYNNFICINILWCNFIWIMF